MSSNKPKTKRELYLGIHSYGMSWSDRLWAHQMQCTRAQRLPATKHENTFQFVFDSCFLIVPINIYPIKFVFGFAPIGERAEHLAHNTWYACDISTKSIWPIWFAACPGLSIDPMVISKLENLSFSTVVWFVPATLQNMSIDVDGYAASTRYKLLKVRVRVNLFDLVMGASDR